MEKGWEKHSTKAANKKQKTIAKDTLRRTPIKQNCVYKSRGVPAQGIGATPCKIGETADQHYWFEFNFA